MYYNRFSLFSRDSEDIDLQDGDIEDYGEPEIGQFQDPDSHVNGAQVAVVDLRPGNTFNNMAPPTLNSGPTIGTFEE